MKTKITKLDKLTIGHFRKRLTTALAPLANELGVAIDIGSCAFGESNCKFQLKVALLDTDGKAMTEESDSFRSSAKLFGFEPDDLGRKFTYRGQSYTICGLRPNSRKYTVIAKAANGKSYKFPCREVLTALDRQVPQWFP